VFDRWSSQSNPHQPHRSFEDQQLTTARLQSVTKMGFRRDLFGRAGFLWRESIKESLRASFAALAVCRTPMNSLAVAAWSETPCAAMPWEIAMVKAVMQSTPLYLRMNVSSGRQIRSRKLSLIGTEHFLGLFREGLSWGYFRDEWRRTSDQWSIELFGPGIITQGHPH
jgi:hypothetical protein